MKSQELKEKYDAAVAQRSKTKTALTRATTTYDVKEKEALELLAEHDIVMSQSASAKDIREAMKGLASSLSEEATALESTAATLLEEIDNLNAKEESEE